MSNRNSNLTRNLTRTFPEPNPNTMDYLKLHEHIAKRYDIYLFEDEIKEIVGIVLEMHNEKPEKCTESIERQHKEKGNQLDQVYGAIKEPSNNDQMKTAMQEMFDELHAHSFEIPIGLLAKCEELMEKEKEQLERAWQDGAETAQNDAAKEIRNNYTPNKL